MSLKDTIKEIKEQLAEEEKKETEEAVDALEEEKTEPEVEDKPEEVPEEKPEEKKEPEPEAQPEPKPQEEEKPDSAAFQRLRREAAAFKRKTEELEARLAQSNHSEESTEQPETTENPIIPEIAEVVEEVRMKKAAREFTSMEAEFKRSHKDYEAVASEYAMALAQSIRIQNPRLSSTEIAERAQKTILLKAAGYMQKGFDPVEELYHEAKDLGFSGKSLEKPVSQDETKEEKEIKPDLKKVASNKARSTGMTGASGRSTGNITPTAASKMKVEQFAKLSRAEKAAIYAQLQNAS